MSDYCLPPTDYFFRIENNNYETNSTAYICKKNLPTIITIIEKSTNNPIPIVIPVQWSSNIDGNFGTNAEAKIELVHFNNKESIKISAILTINNKSVKLNEFELNTKIEIKNSFLLTNFGYDINNISDYWTVTNEKKGVPWKFLPANNLDRSSFVAGGHMNVIKAAKISCDLNQVQLNPAIFNTKQQNFTLTHNGVIPDTFKTAKIINSCDSTNLQNLLIANRRNKTMAFIYLVESNDDIQVRPKGTIVLNATDTCIAAGKDQSLDFTPLEVSNKGDFLNIVGDDYISAGADLVCNTEIRPNRYLSPDTIKIKKIFDSLNVVSNKINLFFNHTITVYDSINYDKNNNKILDAIEITDVTNRLFQKYGTNYITVIANNLGKTSKMVDILGIGLFTLNALNQPSYLSNAVYLDQKDFQNYDYFVYIHEFGHCSSGLRHTNSQFPTLSDSDARNNIMYPEAP